MFFVAYVVAIGLSGQPFSGGESKSIYGSIDDCNAANKVEAAAYAQRMTEEGTLFREVRFACDMPGKLIVDVFHLRKPV